MNITIIKNGNIVQNGNSFLGNIIIRNNTISKICKDNFENYLSDKEIKNAKVIDAENLWVLAGFIDTHTHGCNGYDMNHITKEDLNEASYFYASRGVTSFYPTLLTDTKETLFEMLETISLAIPNVQKGAKVQGIHLEGPYLNKQFKGAMPEDLIVKPNIEEFAKYQEKANGMIKILTISPELEGSIPLIKTFCSDVCISLGHSNAEYAITKEAIENGARCSTHTFNAMRGIHQREPGILGAVLESDINCEMICDGHHVHEGNIRLMVKTKGWDKVMAVTDSMCATGLPNGEYMLGVNRVTVVDGVAKIFGTDTLAGSTLKHDQSFKNLLKFTGDTIPNISKAMSENQAKMLGIIDKTGTIDEDKFADIVIMTDKADVLYTFVNGEIKYKYE